MCSVFDKNLTCTILAYILYIYNYTPWNEKVAVSFLITTGIDMNSPHSPFYVSLYIYLL